MKIHILILASSLLLPVVSFGKILTFHKLTSDGSMEIRLRSPVPTAKTKETDAEKTISQIQVRRKQVPLNKSKWKKRFEKTKLKIVMVGDSGCRLKEGKSGGEYQDCNNPKVWPFPQVMKQVAKERPDVIVHLGDFHYREHCTKGQPCEKMSAAVGYGWEPWLKDYFEPAAPAFSVAPWVLVRGNHEDCKRAYQGYFHLMANEDFSQACKEYEEPDVIQLKDVALVNLDTSAVPDAVDPSKENEALWTQRLDSLNRQLEARKISSVWLLTHKPIYGLVKLGSGIAPVNPNLKKYLDASPLKSKVKLIFAGHVHLSQVIKAAGAPLQFVLGNGGTQLDDFQDVVAQSDLKALGLESVQTGSSGFGYAVFEREAQTPDHWSVQFKDETGKVQTHCQLQTELGVCSKL